MIWVNVEIPPERIGYYKVRNGTAESNRAYWDGKKWGRKTYNEEDQTITHWLDPLG